MAAVRPGQIPPFQAWAVVLLLVHDGCYVVLSTWLSDFAHIAYHNLRVLYTPCYCIAEIALPNMLGVRKLVSESNRCALLPLLLVPSLVYFDLTLDLEYYRTSWKVGQFIAPSWENEDPLCGECNTICLPQHEYNYIEIELLEWRVLYPWC